VFYNSRSSFPEFRRNNGNDMNLKHGWKQRLKVYELPPPATIFPFQRRHVIVNRLKLPEIPSTAMRIMNGVVQPEATTPHAS
jgi:hypothetical protein